jgi:hypothetical protein
MRLTYLVGNHMPISVFGLLLIVVLTANPLLHRLKASWALRPAELAVIVALMLVSCSIPGSGLMRQFTLVVSQPARITKQNQGFQKAEVMKYIPPQMIAGGREYNDEVMALLSGKTLPKGTVDLSAVPWGHWIRGEVYSIDRVNPTATITRLDADPTASTFISWSVVFSEPVTTFGTGNIALATTGVAGAFISSVSGSGANYTVVANTGTGDGTIGLDLTDGTGIADAVGNRRIF